MQTEQLEKVFAFFGSFQDLVSHRHERRELFYRQVANIAFLQSLEEQISWPTT